MIKLKRIVSLIFFSALYIPGIISYHEDISFLISHITNAIEKADSLSSNISPDILGIPGLSSPRIRHLLNNICSVSHTNYLEIGVWQGSTFIAALYKNQDSIISATAIDNWSEFGGPRNQFIQNAILHIKDIPFKLIDADAFSLKLSNIPEKINVFFYDGNHSYESQKAAFTYFNRVFDNIFIAIVDDYDWESVHKGTQDAFNSLDYTVHFEKHLPSAKINDSDGWWNGIYIALISKNN